MSEPTSPMAEAQNDRRMQDDGANSVQSLGMGRLSTTSLTHRDYTVGWICALPKEQTAAKAMLDLVHPKLSKPSADQNAYTLGRIGEHNVVIACLPKGQIGTNSAAKVATWMTSTFPSIRVGLVVGIGGGVPPVVKLGDVVISTPTDDYPGVIQWDMGKAVDSGGFKRTGSLNNPPTMLLTALTNLESQHDMYGSKISQYLDDMATKYPPLRSRYLWSDSLVDPYIELGGIHAPQVHYGLIASGNQVVKDGTVRDNINKSLGGNLLCLEMEAAGLMHDFPCIVIRGICDYADSHKNNCWQEYAAAVAAACAKELLEMIDPVEVTAEPEARQVMHLIDDLALATGKIALKQEQQIQIQAQQADETRKQKLFKWLSPLNPFARHFENQNQRVDGTGIWLLESPEFLNWLSMEVDHSVLLCHGNPGVGKTIITSLVIDQIEQYVYESSGIGVGFIYCDYRDPKAQSVESMFGAILQQLLRSLSRIPSAVWQCCKKPLEDESCLTLAEISDLLQILSAEFSKVYICIDALDETNDLHRVMSVLRDRPHNTQLFLTGRSHVQDVIHKYLSNVQSISIEAHESDIKQFIEREIGGLNDLEPDAMDHELRKNMTEAIVAGANGIFLLPVLQIRAVLQHLTIGAREKSLNTLPSNLSEAFVGTFTRIQQQPEAFTRRATQMIAWIHLARSPISVDTLLGLLTVKESDKNFDYRDIPIRKTLLSCCHGLVIRDKQTGYVRLVHYSLDEYLQLQDEIFGLSRAEWHGRMSVTCLTFLSFPAPLGNEGIEAAWIRDVFFNYAATEWCHHVRLNDDSEAHCLKLAKLYLQEGWQSNKRSLQRLYLVMYNRYTKRIARGMHPAHIAAFFGLQHILTHIGAQKFNLDSRDDVDRTPLVWASDSGFVSVVQFLISEGAAMNHADALGSAPLSIAAKRGHTEVVRELLRHSEVDINTTDRVDTTPLYWAAGKGHIHIMRLLIKAGADINHEDYSGFHPLTIAVMNGHVETAIELLHHPDVDVNRVGYQNGSPLVRAAEEGYVEIVRELIKKGANINDGLYNGFSALTITITGGHDAVVQEILAHPDVDVNWSGYSGRPVSCAIKSRNIELVQQLIRMGSDVDSSDWREEPAVLLALKERYHDLAQQLLANGAYVDLSDSHGETALLFAAEGGHTKIVEQLLMAGANVDLEDGVGSTPLLKAARAGHVEVVKQLLVAEADVNVQNAEGESALLCAAENGHTEIVRQVNEGGTALTLAAKHGHWEIVRLLREAARADNPCTIAEGDVS